jgi:hypothetical protein
MEEEGGCRRGVISIVPRTYIEEENSLNGFKSENIKKKGEKEEK